MTSDLKPLAVRSSGTLACRLAFRASVLEKKMLLYAAKKHGLGLGEYILALHRHYLNQEKP